MKNIHKIVFIILLLLVPSFVHGFSVNILINQLDGIQDSVRDSVSLFENSIMDFLFDAGCIVSSENVSLEK